jgi:alpha-ketoglutarate-dependent taurine dioxygenase
MQRRKLPGFGSLGGEIYDVNLATATPQEVRELGEHNLRDLVTVVRRESVAGIDADRFHAIATSWAIPTHNGNYELTNNPNELTRKYGENWFNDRSRLDPADLLVVEEMDRLRSGLEHLRGMVRITGMRDEHGNNTGMFSEGLLDWHSNQQGTTYYAPGAGLLSISGTANSRTDFLNTVDPYNALSREWQTMCDELVAVHRWKKGVMAPGVSEVQDRLLQMHMVPQDDVEVPLVNTSPAGYKGLHFPYTSIHHFKGMSEAESDKVIAYLKDHIMREEYMYKHEWQDGEVVLFDNTVTLHCRPTPDTSKRLLYRLSYNFDRILQDRKPRAAAV